MPTKKIIIALDSKNLNKKLDKSINKYLEIEKKNKLDKINQENSPS